METLQISSMSDYLFYLFYLYCRKTGYNPYGVFNYGGVLSRVAILQKDCIPRDV